MAQETSRTKSVLAVLMGLLALGLSIAMVVTALRTVLWRSTTGTVLSGKIQSTVSGRINLHKPIIQYEYVVAGKKYIGSRYTLVPMDDEGTEEWARGILATHPAGSKCRVFYRPGHPDASVLRRTPRASFYFLTAFFGLVLGLGSVLGGISLHREGRKTPA